MEEKPPGDIWGDIELGRAREARERAREGRRITRDNIWFFLCLFLSLSFPLLSFLSLGGVMAEKRNKRKLRHITPREKIARERDKEKDR